MTMERSERLRLAFEKATGGKLTIKDAAKRWGWNAHTLKSNMNGHASFGFAAAAKYARRLGVNAEWLYTGEGEMRAMPNVSHEARDLPIVSWVAAAGIRHPADLYEVDELDRITISGLSDGDYFACQMQDDSMNRVALPGAVIIVRIDNNFPSSGGYYLFSLEGEPAFRRYEESPWPRLEAESWNGEYRTFFLAPNHGCEVIGTVEKTVTDVLQNASR